MGINLINLVTGLGATNAKSALLMAAVKTLRKHPGKERITIPTEELERMPDFIKRLVNGLENPTVQLGRNSSRGQSLWGLSVKDGEKPVANYAMSMDIARNGSKSRPIWQYREQVYTDGKKAYTTTEKFDAAQTVGDTTEFTSTVQKSRQQMSVETQAGSAYAESITCNKAGYEELVKKGIKENSLQDVEESFAETTNLDHLQSMIKDLRRPTSSKTNFFFHMNSMDLQAIESTMTKYQARIKKLEQELDDLYAQAIGRDAQWAEKDSDFVFAKYVADRIVPKINPKTGEKIPKELREKIILKNRQYATDKFILNNLNLRKIQQGGYGQVLSLDEKYAKEVVKRYNIRPQKFSRSAVRELKKLRTITDKEEVMRKARDIISREYGIPGGLLDVKAMSDEIINECPAAFFVFLKNSYTIQYNPNMMQFLDNDMIITLMGHELQHAKDFIQIAKSMGFKSFKLLLNDNKLDPINESLWQNVITKMKPSKFNSEMLYNVVKYEAASSENYLQNVRYFSNYLEKRAYQKGFDINYAMNKTGHPESNLVMSDVLRTEQATAIRERLDKLKAIHGESFNMEEYFEQLQRRAVLRQRNLAEKDARFKLEDTMLKIIEEDLSRYHIVEHAKKENIFKRIFDLEKEGLRIICHSLRSLIPV